MARNVPEESVVAMWRPHLHRGGGGGEGKTCTQVVEAPLVPMEEVVVEARPVSEEAAGVEATPLHEEVVEASPEH